MQCSSTHPIAIRAAKEFPAKLFAVHGDKIVLRDSAVYHGNGCRDKTQTIDVRCSVCLHDWSPTAQSLLKGRSCPQCFRNKVVESAGVVRKRRSTKAERQRAIELRDSGFTYTEIARTLNRSVGTVHRWIDPSSSERKRIKNAEWLSRNREHHNASRRRYRTQYDHGKAGVLINSATYRLLRLNAPEFVFLDGEWHEVDRRQTYRVFGEVLVPTSDRQAIEQVYLEAQQLTEQTGIEHHVDHIHPLAVGGEHLAINLQILTAEENLSKGATFRLEDQAELARRLFGIS